MTQPVVWCLLALEEVRENDLCDIILATDLKQKACIVNRVVEFKGCGHFTGFRLHYEKYRVQHFESLERESKSGYLCLSCYDLDQCTKSCCIWQECYHTHTALLEQLGLSLLKHLFNHFHHHAIISPTTLMGIIKPLTYWTQCGIVLKAC